MGANWKSNPSDQPSSEKIHLLMTIETYFETKTTILQCDESERKKLHRTTFPSSRNFRFKINFSTRRGKTFSFRLQKSFFSLKSKHKEGLYRCEKRNKVYVSGSVRFSLFALVMCWRRMTQKKSEPYALSSRREKFLISCTYFINCELSFSFACMWREDNECRVQMEWHKPASQHWLSWFMRCEDV